MEPGAAPTRPRLRGVLHQWAFVATLPLGTALALTAHTSLARAGAIAFAASVTTMFGASALYHRITWRPPVRRWLRRLDHAMIYALIAGTYTPFGLLVLGGAWRIVILAIVWSGAFVAIVLKLFWVDAPKWLSAAIGIALGWVGAVVFPQIVSRTGVVAALLVLGGGLCYTAGAIVYARRRPNPVPGVFGYHELFHALVIGAVSLHYTSVAFFVIPRH